MLIELDAGDCKTLLPSGSYDEKVLLREEMEIEIARSNIRKEHQLKELYQPDGPMNMIWEAIKFFQANNEDR